MHLLFILFHDIGSIRTQFLTIYPKIKESDFYLNFYVHSIQILLESKKIWLEAHICFWEFQVFFLHLQRVILRVLSPNGPSSNQPLRQLRVLQWGSVRCRGNRPSLPVSPRLWGWALWNTRQRQLHQPRVLPAVSLQPPLATDQHQSPGKPSSPVRCLCLKTSVSCHLKWRIFFPRISTHCLPLKHYILPLNILKSTQIPASFEIWPESLYQVYIYIYICWLFLAATVYYFTVYFNNCESS